jgi:hypothetical protein
MNNSNDNMNNSNDNMNNSNDNMNNNKDNIFIPNLIFIVPYRDRLSHLMCFINQMTYLLEFVKEKYNLYYEIIISHQTDNQTFNRGAMKNLGFIYAKNKYPEHYKNITFVFNDVDTFPGICDLINYKTQKGIIRHFYGFDFTLGGIFSITGYDFELLNGFPNYWGWGFEDNCIYNRALKKNIKIDRSIFFEFNNMNILQFYNGTSRTLDNMVIHKLSNDNGSNGIKSITNISQRTQSINDYFDSNKIYYSNTYSNKLLNNIIILNNNKWEIPEKVDSILFETKQYTKYVYQRKVNMSNIVKSSNLNKNLVHKNTQNISTKINNSIKNKQNKNQTESNKNVNKNAQNLANKNAQNLLFKIQY